MPVEPLTAVSPAVSPADVAAAAEPNGTPRSAPEPVVALSPDPVDLESAIARVRALYFGQDFHEGAAVGQAALEQWPDSPELVAWTVTNMARSGQWAAAVERAEATVAAAPADVWGHIALAFALAYHGPRRGEALEASLRPLELAPTMPEAVWLRGFVLQNQRQQAEVPDLVDEKWPVVDRPWAELLTIKGNALLAMRFDDPDRLEEGLAVLAEARELDPDNVNAHFFAASVLLGDRRADEALPLFERAVALSPGSSSIASAHWRAIRARADMEAEEKTAAITAAAAALVEIRGQYPATLRAIASTYRQLDLEEEASQLEDRVLAEFPGSGEAEWILADGWRDLSRRIREGKVEDSAAAHVELRSLWWSFVRRPEHHQQGLLGEAYRNLFQELMRDDESSADTLLMVVREMTARDSLNSSLKAQSAIALADRGAHVEDARGLALEAIDSADDYVSERMAMFEDAGSAAMFLDRTRADAYAALAHVEMKAGDLTAAREAMDQALELFEAGPGIQLRAGALAEAEGDLETAEIHHARGYQLERPSLSDNKPNRDALERIFQERHGSMDGYDEFLEEIEGRDRERRWQRVADSRLAEPRELPAIELEWLHGGNITRDELAGRIVVINFWGVWCGPCVAESPQIQQLHEKYRDEPGVAFLTINYGDEPDRVRTWMEENDYDWPVLLDDDFVMRAGVRAFPTTWFVTPDGQIVFEHRGASAVVFEEFVWRIEMLQSELAEAEAGPAVEAASRTPSPKL